MAKTHYFPALSAASISFLSAVFLTLTISLPALAESPSPGAHVGVGSCASSQCHGSVAPRETSSVLQNEYTTWKKHDPHSRAWQVLLNEDSKRIAHHLGIGAPEKAPQCLECHSTHVTGGNKQPSFQVEDGVGCESCHGAAEKWLASHAARDATHASNVQAGMTDLSSASSQATLCLSCHFGNDNKYVNHRLIGAGHPRLSFELDTFQNIQPRHWVVDDDYRKRKEDYSAPNAWFTGQVAQAYESLNRLQSAKRAKQGVFPEFALFDCASCHHSLTEDQWKKREYDGQPGVPKLNLASLAMVREALHTSNPAVANQLRNKIDLLHASFIVGGNGQTAAINELKGILNRHADGVESVSPQKLLAHFVKYAGTDPHLPYEVGEQIAMALSVFASTIQPDGSLHKKELDGIYETLKNPRNFIPEQFAAAARVFEAKVTGKR